MRRDTREPRNRGECTDSQGKAQKHARNLHHWHWVLVAGFWFWYWLLVWLLQPAPARATRTSNQFSALSWLYFFQRITHHGQSLLVADVEAVTHTPP